jgi:hypothetical protein
MDAVIAAAARALAAGDPLAALRQVARRLRRGLRPGRPGR